MDIPTIMIFIVGVLLLPMVFIRILDVNSIRKKPSLIIIAAGFFVLIGFITAFLIFSSQFSMAIIAFSSLLILPFVIKILESEKLYHETKTKKNLYNWFNPSNLSGILNRHDRLIKFYIFLFLGMVLEYAFLFAILDPNISQASFEQQLEIFGPSGRFFDEGFFLQIVENNLQILIISFALSVFYGAGSILILNYNASIVGIMYGSTFRTLIWGTPLFYSNILLYIPHTILEVTAYLLAAVSGGLLVQGVRKEIISDTLVLFIFSVILIFIAGYVEVTLLTNLK